jgi:histidinol dehydrogenase
MPVPVIATTAPAFKAALRKILLRREERERSVAATVEKIIRGVRKGGDRALLDYTRRFDRARLSMSELEVTPREVARALEEMDSSDLRALKLAARRIAAFHRRQVERSWGYRDSAGLYLGQKVAPLDRVGVYVPGGKAAYPSTVLMNVIPAKVAGVREVILASPMGDASSAVLAAAKIAGADRIFRIGGAQAIAALAYGTQRIPKVDKIVGPGNIYVATAKRLVFGAVDIDSIAGPSEILLLADGSADPDHVAADMLSQAEHDELAASVCVTTSRVLARRVRAALALRLKASRRRAIAARSLRHYGAVFFARTMREGIDLVDQIAPEHVAITARQPRRWSRLINNAGAIFVGPYSTPPLGDYMAGPNHVLPTGGSARFFSPLGAYDFFKRTSIIEASPAALRRLAPSVIRLARLEGLYDHARAVEARFAKERFYGQKG